MSEFNSDENRPVKPKKIKAHDLAKKQRSISISEFFAKNKQLLGFDSPARALMTTVKEAVDNALDACEEAGILPTLRIEVSSLGDDRLRVSVEDNGPGIVREQIPRIFGQLLYGSKFHSLKQSRGQQGIGISAAGMYGQLTTGRPVKIISRIDPGHPAHHFHLIMDLKKNKPKIILDEEIEFDAEHGTRIVLDIVGVHKSGRHSIDEYLAQTAIANPHVEIEYKNAKGEEFFFERVSEKLPREPLEIKPHPYGVELGILMKILRETTYRRVSTALQNEFSRVTGKVAEEICKVANVSITRSPKRMSVEEIEAIHKAIANVKIMAPPATAVVPIGERQLRRGLAREIKDAEFYVSRTRPPAVYLGNPFIIEVALAYGGQLKGAFDNGDTGEFSLAGVELDPSKTVAAAFLDLPGFTRKKSGELADRAGISRRLRVKNISPDDMESLRLTYNDFTKKEASSSPAQMIRLANRVPLLYQQKACVISKAVMDINWRRYGVSQPKGGFPQGAMVLIIHMASVKVKFTSESKEAIAQIPEVLAEMRLAIQECGRDLGNYLKKKSKLKAALDRKETFKRYSGELARVLADLTGKDETYLHDVITSATEQFTVNNFETEMPDLEGAEAYTSVLDDDEDEDVSESNPDVDPVETDGDEVNKADSYESSGSEELETSDEPIEVTDSAEFEESIEDNSIEQVEEEPEEPIYDEMDYEIADSEVVVQDSGEDMEEDLSSGEIDSEKRESAINKRSEKTESHSMFLDFGMDDDGTEK
jgi:DNA topoisomerase VI subunit B